jgi:hypothetical protein
MLRPTVSRPVCLCVRHPPGDQYHIVITVRRAFVYVGRPLWLEDESLVYSCGWSSQAQPYLSRMNSRGHSTSWILIQFRWHVMARLLIEPLPSSGLFFSSHFLGIPAIATETLVTLFLVFHNMFRPLRAILRGNTTSISLIMSQCVLA